MIPDRSSIAGWTIFILIPILMLDWGVSRFVSLVRTSELHQWELNSARKVWQILNYTDEEELTKFWFHRSEHNEGKYLFKNSREMRRAESARPRGMRDANLLRIPKGGACPPLLKSMDGKTNPGFVAHFPAKPGDNPLLLNLAAFLSSGKEPPEKTYWEIKNQLGWMLDLKQLSQIPEKPLLGKWGRDPAGIMWKRNKQTGAISLRVFPLPGLEQRLKLALDRGCDYNSETIGVLNSRSKRFYGTPGISKPRLMASLQKRRKENLINVDHGRFFSHVEMLNEGMILYLETRCRTKFPQEFLSGFRIFLLFILIAFSLCIRQLRTIAEYLPLQVKSLGIFSLAIVLPLLGAASLCATILSQLENEKTREVLQSARADLMKFDGDFDREVLFTQRLFQGILRDPVAKAHNFVGFEKEMTKAFNRQLIDRIEIRDWQNNQLYKKFNGRSDRGFDMLMESFSLMVIARVLPEMARKREKSLNPEQFFTAAFIDTPEFGFSEICKRPNVIHYLKYGKNLFYFFWGSEKTSTQPKSNAVYCMTRTLRQMISNYLRKNLIRKRPIRILAHDRVTGKWFPALRATFEMEAFASGIRRSGEDQIGHLRVGDKSYLAIGISPLALRDFDLIGLVNDESVTDFISSWKKLMAWGLFLAILGGGISALFLSNSFLVPLRQLFKGIEALKERNISYRIPPLGDDELGKTGEAFNQMIATIHELDMAKTVQESLIPSSPPCPDGYEVFLHNTMMVSIGGDYCDCFKLPDGRIAFMIGDVSGHGIGAALFMSMAKTTVFFHFEEGGSDENIMERLNEVLYELRKRGQFMSFCFGTLDPQNHRISIRIAGHPHPIFQDQSNSKLDIPSATYPLGSKKKQTFSVVNHEMSPGSTILLYTDGIVEASDPQGNPFSYERLENLVKINSDKGAKRTVECCLDELSRFAAGVPVNDDVTLFAIHRQAVFPVEAPE